MPDDFDRDVYCVAGLPFDAVSMADALSVLKSAARSRTRCFLSTPNLNFLIASRSDAAFRDSVIHSNLVVADGMPLVWIAKLLRIPVRERVAGSSLFEALRVQQTAHPMRVYFFGGPDGVAESAAQRINRGSTGMVCAGYQSPGFVSLEEMNTANRIAQINDSNADFLVVALGAKKGQAWIVQNLPRLNAPIISHLGAVVNFEAHKLKRAPAWMQHAGLEWLWRIKEEPELWRRYWHDGLGLLKLLATDVIPHALWLMRRQRHLNKSGNNNIYFECAESCRLIISGVVLDPVPAGIRSTLREASLKNSDVEIDLADAEYLSPGFLGLVLLLKKHLDEQHNKLKITGARPEMKRLLKWNGLLPFLLNA